MPRIEVIYNADGILCGRQNGESDDAEDNLCGLIIKWLESGATGQERLLAKETPIRWLLIVTGSTLRAEEMDRPLAYYLKQRVESSLAEAVANGHTNLKDYLVRVVADFRWIHDEPLQSLPTISLGGPGVSALAHRWLEEVPVSLAFSERYFIQMDPDLAEPRASIWGMDNASTQIAVSVFVDRFLSRFLDRCAIVPAHLSALDSGSDTDAGTDVDDDENGV
jgi:hypothetical protein